MIAPHYDGGVDDDSTDNDAPHRTRAFVATIYEGVDELLYARA